MDVPAGGQHPGAVAQQVAARGGGDVLAPQAIEQMVDLLGAALQQLADPQGIQQALGLLS